MQDDEQQKQDKRPIEMDTEEAIDYLFAPEIAERLRREAGKLECPDPESED